MTIHAKEAHQQSQDLNEEATGKMIGTLDSKIEQAVYAGDFSITTPQLTTKLKESIRNHYEEYGYEVVDFNNNMFGINW